MTEAVVVGATAVGAPLTHWSATCTAGRPLTPRNRRAASRVRNSDSQLTTITMSGSSPAAALPSTGCDSISLLPVRFETKNSRVPSGDHDGESAPPVLVTRVEVRVHVWAVRHRVEERPGVPCGIHEQRLVRA